MERPRQKLPPTKAQKEAARLALAQLTNEDEKKAYYAQQERERLERERQMQAFMENQRRIEVEKAREEQRLYQEYIKQLEEQARLDAIRVQKEMREEALRMEEEKKMVEAIKEAKRLRLAQEKKEREEAKKEKEEQAAEQKKKRTEPLIDNVFKYHVSHLNATLKAEQAKADLIVQLMKMAFKKNMNVAEIQDAYQQMLLRLEQSGMKMPSDVHIRTGYQMESGPVKKKQWIETMVRLLDFLMKRAMHQRAHIESQLRQDVKDQYMKAELKALHQDRYKSMLARNFQITKSELKQIEPYRDYYQSMHRLQQLKTKSSLTPSEEVELQNAVSQEVLEEMEEREHMEGKKALMEQYTAEVKHFQKNIADLMKLYEMVSQ